MEEYKYYLEYNSQKTEIIEPIGWDGFESIIRRNENSYGISTLYSDTTLKFFDLRAINVIKDAYDDDIDSIVTFSVENNGVIEFESVVNMLSYTEGYDDYRYIEVDLYDVGLQSMFNNRQEQKVNIDSLESFDGAVLPAYSNLRKEVTLIAKDILAISSAKQEDSKDKSVEVIAGNPDILYFSIPLGNEPILDEIGGMTVSDSLNVWHFDTSGSHPPRPESVVFYYSKSDGKELKCINSDIDMYVSLNINIDVYQVATRGGFRVTFGYGVYDRDTNLVDFYQDEIFKLSGGSEIPSFINVNIKDNHYTLTDLPDEATIYMMIMIESGYDAGNTANRLNVEFTDCALKLENLSRCEDTTAIVSMPHEVLSRIVEATTNNGLTVKSDYYGRADSNINPVSISGGGAMRSLTKGLRIRRYINESGDEPALEVSFVDIFKGLQAIDNIGYGISNENGNSYIRIEPYEWFFKDDVIAVINNPIPKERSVNATEVYNQFKTGYKKYETEGTNGLDAISTEREYRLRQKSGSSKLEQVSDFVADSYAIEYTRRLADDKSTKDWRYDNDIFAIQLKYISGSYSVDIGADTSQNIISPSTLYNIDISPARNARRWLNRLFSWSHKTEELIYTSGKGNINAMSNNIFENANISVTDARTSPVVKSEKLTITCPLTQDEYANIRNNPYGIIIVDGEECYIQEVKLKHKTYIATITLIPKW